MTAREFVKNIKVIRRKINLLEEKIERDTHLASGVGAIRYDKERVQTSIVGDRMADIVSKIIESTDELKKEILNLQEQETIFISYLVRLSDTHERILSDHYLNGIKWKVIEEKMHYSDNYIYEMKEAALDELDKVMGESDIISSEKIPTTGSRTE